MKKATTIIALGFVIILGNVASAGNGGGGVKLHFGNGGNHNVHHNQHHSFHHKYQHNVHHHGRHNYGYAVPFAVPSFASSAPPRPIVVNSPINIVNPVAPARVRVEKVVAKPEAKVEMGGTVRVTSDKIEDTGKGRATMKVGHGYKKLKVVQWSDGLAVLEVPALHYKTDKEATLLIFNGPGKLATRVDVLLVEAELSPQQDGQYVATDQ